MPYPTYDDVLTANLRRIRAGKRLGQATVTGRMRALGFTAWHRQTVGKIERGERRVLAAEILGLALALETSVGVLMDPGPDDERIDLPSGDAITAGSLARSVRHRNDGTVQWGGEVPRFGEPAESLATPESIGRQTWPSVPGGRAPR